MKRFNQSIQMLLMLLLLAVLPVKAAPKLMTATQVVEQSDQSMRGDSSYSEITMQIIRPDWQRSMRMKSWTKGQQLSMVLVLSPAKDKGSASLKRDREMWSWIPSIERVIKIAPSMLSQSWMGSDFTNDDLINQSSIVVDYDHQFTGEVTIDGDLCWQIEAIAKPDAPVVWSKVQLAISKTTHLQRQAVFFDEFGEVVNTLSTFEVVEMGGRPVTQRLEMVPADKPGHKTVLINHEVAFDFAIEDNFFSLQQLKSLRD